MKYTEEIIKQKCQELSDKYGDKFTIPVTISNRMTSCLGKVSLFGNKQDCFPTGMKFSKSFLETSNDTEIESVIQHEWCHYYLTKKTGQHHGHDAQFKALCAEIGCINDGTCLNRDLVNGVISTDTPKYEIYCPECGKTIDSRQRMCKTLMSLNKRACPYCEHIGLKYRQNYY